MGADQDRIMTESTLAGRMYAAYRHAVEHDGEDGGEALRLPAFADLADKGAAWYAAANALDRLKEPPLVPGPSVYVLCDPIAERKSPSGVVIAEQIPTTLAVRQMVASDLCAGDRIDGAEAKDYAQQAHVHGLPLDMFEERVSYIDAEAARIALRSSQGEDASTALRRAFIAAGGKALLGDEIAWVYVALAALETDLGDHYLLICRTADVGTVQIGPLRVKHVRIYVDVGTERGEWSGRIAALAAITGRPIESVRQWRIEDVTRAWACVDRLKKKSEALGLGRFVAGRSTPSTDGGPGTSTTSPSPS